MNIILTTTERQSVLFPALSKNLRRPVAEKLYGAFLVVVLSFFLTASHSFAQTFFSETFESLSGSFSASGTGWIQEDVSGTAGNWAIATGTVNPSGSAAHGGSKLAYFNSYTADAGNKTRLISPTIDASSATIDPILEFWLFRNTRYSASLDSLRIYVSIDNGATWSYRATFQRYIATSNQWEKKTISLTGTAGRSTIKLAFEGCGAYGDDIHIDDVVVKPPPPMEFISTSTIQVTGTVGRSVIGLPVVIANVVTDGVSSPLSATSFTFNTNGTTNPADILNARVYYTGSNLSLSTNNQFGSVIASPNGTLTFTGTQALGGGNNYFWLVVDVSPIAGLNNLIDGEYVSSVIDGVVRTPAISAPDGSLAIGYCNSLATNTADTYISEVKLGSINNNTTSASGGTYSNFTSSVAPTQLNLGDTYSISVAKNTTDVTEYGAWLNVFIDWNNDFDFDDPGERVFSQTAPVDATKPLPRLYTGSFTVPPTATLGTTRMRVIMQEGGAATSSPCTQYSFGETEDYAVTIAERKELMVGKEVNFGNIGSKRRMTIDVQNSAYLQPLVVQSLALSGTGATSFKVYVPGTNQLVTFPMSIQPRQIVQWEVEFGSQTYSVAGQQNATMTLAHSGDNSPSMVNLMGHFASLTAMDETKNLLAAGAKLDVGGVQPGPGQVTKEFRLGASVSLPASFPLVINNYQLSGIDAAIFQVSTLPVGITGENLVSVTLRALGAEPGTKRATLTINHTGANGPVTTIQLEGRIGQPVLGAPSLVTLPPVSAGQSYTSVYDNAALIPLTRAGAVDIQFLKTPTFTGSGAALMELLSNGGMYFVRGVYNGQGQVVVAGNGSLADAANWVNPILTPIAVTETQPLLLAVRMKAAGTATPLGSYDATLLLSDGSGNGVSNAVNVVSTTVIGEVLNDPNILPFYPGQLAFGSTPIGTTQMRTLTVRNQSGSAGMVQLAITGTEYSFSNGGRAMSIALPATKDPVSVVVRFSPTSSGAANGVITVSGVMSGSVALSGSGQAANAGNLLLLVDGQPLEGTVNFGTVGIGSIGSKTVTIINNNIGPVTVSSIGRSGANATQFGVSALSAMEIAGNGGSATFNVTFMPTSLSVPQKNATIAIFNSTGIPKVFNVQGVAAVENGNTMSVTLTPASYHYGNQSGSHSFTLTNTGNSAIVVNGGIVLGSSNFTLADNTTTFPRTVSVGASTTLMVNFNAGQGVNGLRSASLIVLTAGVTPYPTSSLTGVVGSGGIGAFGGVAMSTDTEIPNVIEVIGSYPNPCTVESELRYRLSSSAPVTVYVYDVDGRQLLARNAGIQRAGEQAVGITTTNLQSGTYYYIVEAGGQRAAGVLVVKK